MKPHFLQQIKVATTRRLAQYDEADLQQQANAIATINSFTDALAKQEVTQPHIIAEIKFASPSKGLIKTPSNPVDIAKAYIDNGASALSVITEPTYFKGSIDSIKAIRRQLPTVNILMKDFFIHTKQVYLAKIAGANAILLITQLLNDLELHNLYELAMQLHLTPIIEVHTLNDVKRALQLKPSVIGINNRNLQDLSVDITHAMRISAYIPDNIVKICESGIQSGKHIQQLQQYGFSNFLIGSSFMKSPCPGESLATLLKESTNAY